MTSNEEFLNIDIKIEKTEPDDDDFTEETLIVDNFKTQTAVIKSESENENINSREIEEKNEKLIILQKTLLNDSVCISPKSKPSNCEKKNWHISKCSLFKQKIVPKNSCEIEKKNDELIILQKTLPNDSVCISPKSKPSNCEKKNWHISKCSLFKRKIEPKKTLQDINPDLIIELNTKQKEIASLSFVSLKYRRNIFHRIYKGLISPPEVPSEEWGFHRITKNGKRTLLYTELGMFDNNQTNVPQVRKMVIFDNDLNADVYIYGDMVLQRHLYTSTIKLMVNLELFLREIDSYGICIGGPPASNYPNMNPKYVVKNKFGILRHAKCKRLIKNRKLYNFACEHCLNLEHTLIQHMQLL